MRELALTAGMVVVTALLFFGCSATETAVDCNGICNRHRSCFDSSYAKPQTRTPIHEELS